MPPKRNKIQYFYNNSDFLVKFQVRPFRPRACVAWKPPAAGWTTSDFLQLKTVFPSTRNAIFWKKLASRLDETPTSELGFSGHGPGRQKKVLKTQGFSMFFLAMYTSRCGVDLVFTYIVLSLEPSATLSPLSGTPSDTSPSASSTP